MSKSKSPDYYFFTVTLLTSILIAGTLVAMYTGLAKSPKIADPTDLWFTLIALLVISLTHLFFSIKGWREQYRKRDQVEKILTIIIKKIRLEGENAENSVIQSVINEVKKKPSDYQEYLRSLEPNLQEVFTQFCLRAEINLRGDIANSLSKADPRGEGLGSLSASETLVRDARPLAVYEEIRSYCN